MVVEVVGHGRPGFYVELEIQSLELILVVGFIRHRIEMDGLLRRGSKTTKFGDAVFTVSLIDKLFQNFSQTEDLSFILT